jgi:8-oxo-dGTP diphosphatase
MPDSPPNLRYPPAIQRRGAVAIVVRDGRCLMIRRAEGIVAPGAYCFPGGGIEPGESETEALRRELREELNVDIEPIVRVWESITPWGVHLAWWTAHLAESVEPVASPAEVAEVLWRDWTEMRSLPGLLSSNLAFLDALERGDIVVGSTVADSAGN